MDEGVAVESGEDCRGPSPPPLIAIYTPYCAILMRFRHFIRFVTAFYTRFSMIARNKARTEIYEF